MPLAVESYDKIASLRDDPDCLNLAWTLDERDCLAVDLRATMIRELEGEISSELEYVESYFVKDPYGASHMAPVLASYFGPSLAQVSVTCGAGVAALLAALAGLARERPVEIIGETYPDFPFWVRRAGGSSIARRGPTGPMGERAIAFFERPTLRGDMFDDLAEVRDFCRDAADHRTIVLIDESNANYCPPAYSAVSLAGSLDNLMVVRGLSKAYGMGGLRMGYCIASPALEGMVRAVVPPLLVSSLSLRLARAILALGDITAPLRETITRRKFAARKQLERLGLAENAPANHRLPYLLFDATGQAPRRLAEAGIRGKLHAISSADGDQEVYRLSVPLHDDRVRSLQAKIDGMTLV